MTDSPTNHYEGTIESPLEIRENGEVHTYSLETADGKTLRTTREVWEYHQAKIDAAVAAERERCAKIAVQYDNDSGRWTQDERNLALLIASEIRKG